MKVQAAMAVLAFVAAQAAAVPEAQPFAAPAADAEPKKIYGKVKNWHGKFCGVPGQACYRKREADAEPKKIYGKVKNWHGKFCGVPGQACYKRRDADELADVGNEVGFCGSPGQPCALAKRAANAIAEAVAEADADPKKIYGKVKNWHGKFCGVPGQACYKARDLSDTVVDHVNDVYGAIYEREAEAEAAANPEADPKKTYGKVKNWHGKFCGVPGQACYRRRDAEALADANQKIKREADAEADPKKIYGKVKNWHGKFCGVPGQACYRKRDAEAIASAIKSSNPGAFKAECFKDGGECDTLLKIQKAWAKSKQANVDEKHIKNPKQALAHCGGKNECTSLTHAHQYAKQHGPRSAQEAEDACNGPDGLCTLARRDLEGIEETINAAVDALAADSAEEEVEEADEE